MVSRGDGWSGRPRPARRPGPGRRARRSPTPPTLIEYETSCGIKVWGHSGGIHGPSTQAFGTKDGGQVIALNCNGDWVGGGKNVVSAEFCRLPTSTQPPAPATSG